MNPFYKLDIWKNPKYGKRIQALRRDKYLCQNCLRYGKRVDASHVHHIWPLDMFPQWALKLWNLISLCEACHNKMHDRQTHQLTAEGKRLQNIARPGAADS